MDWMAWTWPTAIFFTVIASILILFTALAIKAPETPRVITRQSTAGQEYGIKLSRQGSRSAADKLLLRTALQELDTLDSALRRIDRVGGGFAPIFVGLSQRSAERACVRLRARDVDCDIILGG